MDSKVDSIKEWIHIGMTASAQCALVHLQGGYTADLWHYTITNKTIALINFSQIQKLQIAVHAITNWTTNAVQPIRF